MNRSIISVAWVALAIVIIVLAGCQWLGPGADGPPADPALKGCWSFDEGSGGVAGNAAGGKDGKVPSSLEWVEGKQGKALLFSGKEFVVVESCPCFNAPQYTVSAWTKFKNTADHHYIVWKAGPVFPEDTDARRFDLWTGLDGTVHGLMHDEQGFESLHIQGSTDIADDTWHHVALTYDGKVITLYVDGKKEHELTPQAPLAKNDHDLWIGGRPEGVVATGIIDEVRFYTRALTAEEIAALIGTK